MEPDDDTDPRARWRTMPEPIRPDQWVAEHDTDPIPESLSDAEARRLEQERTYVATRLAGGGGL
ncbi:hypothetical protein [Pseudonocardia phyllosphaerae]|uniref:hypothetical protein n=1 Tax=Pseudonocardia phyllosphaerae TaxID=3390502 RepID=UPI00397D179C